MFSWDEKTPPQDHWVMASYSVLDKPTIVKTCKRGCCVIDPFMGSMKLPSYWRDATDEEIQNIELEIQYDKQRRHTKHETVTDPTELSDVYDIDNVREEDN